MSYSMHELAESRNCKNCFFGDQEALDYNKKAHDEQRWRDYKPYCTYAFRLDLNINFLRCYTWKQKET